MKLRFLILLFLCFSSGQLFTQESSLQEQLDKLQEYARSNGELMNELGEQLLEKAQADNDQLTEAKVLLEYANYNFYATNYTSADSLYDLVVALGDGSLRRTARIRQAFILSELGEIDAADKGFKAQIKTCEASMDTANWIEALNGLANVKTDQYRIDSAVYFYQVGLRLAAATGDTYKQAYLLNNMGLIKMDHDREDEALEDFLKAIELTGTDDKQRLLGLLVNNAALIYMAQEDFEKAELYFRMFLDGAVEVDAWREIGMGLLNLGGVKYQQDDYDSAEYYLDTAMYYLRATNSFLFMPKALAGLGRVYAATERYKEALVLADSAIRMAIPFGILEDHMWAHFVASKAFEGLGQPDSALARYKEYKHLSDSIDELSNENVLNELQVQYEVEKKDNELEQERSRVALLEAERELSAFRWRVGIGVAGGFFVLAIILFVLWRSRSLRKQQEKYSQQLLENVEEERSRIAKDLHDDIGQMLSSIKSKVHIQKERISVKELDELEEALGVVIDKGRNISRALYPSYLRRLGLKEALVGLLKQVETDNQLLCTHDIGDIDQYLQPEQKLHIFRVVQECISNTLKHANATAIKVEIAVQSGTLEVQYRDNGKGIASKSGLSGMGMMSIAERVKLLKGDLDIGSNNGTGFRLKFKFGG